MVIYSPPRQCHSIISSINNPNPKRCFTTSKPSTNKPFLDTLSSPSNTQLRKPKSTHVSESLCAKACCSFRRRSLLIGTATGATLLPSFHSRASDLQFRSQAMLNSIHPQRPEWYEQFYALAMENGMKSYEAEVAGYKRELFTSLRGNEKVLELGIGTGPNLKYYADGSGVSVFGVDPNKSMEKYARNTASAVGLPLSRFNFTQAVGEALPISDASMDAVIGTLVLCSVTNVGMTLQEVKRVLKPGGSYIFVEHVAAKDGTALRFIQNVADPLQQLVSDGCHLTRETGTYISQAGFSSVDINMTFLSSASLIGPHVYGIATK